MFFLNFTQTFLSNQRNAAGFNQYTQSLKLKAFLWVLMPHRESGSFLTPCCCGLYNFLSHKQQVYRCVTRNLHVWCISARNIWGANPASSFWLSHEKHALLLLKNLSMCWIWPLPCRASNVNANFYIYYILLVHF